MLICIRAEESEKIKCVQKLDDRNKDELNANASTSEFVEIKDRIIDVNEETR